MRTRHRQDLTADELALAYELRVAGCCWKRIAQGLHCDHRQLRDAVGHICRTGLHQPGQPGGQLRYTVEQLEAAIAWRADGNSWRRIASALDVDPDAFRSAVSHYKRNRRNRHGNDRSGTKESATPARADGV